MSEAEFYEELDKIAVDSKHRSTLDSTFYSFFKPLKEEIMKEASNMITIPKNETNDQEVKLSQLDIVVESYITILLQRILQLSHKKSIYDIMSSEKIRDNSENNCFGNSTT
jgi:hypothetical protein